jgi:hypothetical protein
VGREDEAFAMGKRINTFLLVSIGLLLAFQWPRGPANTAATDIPLILAIIYAWPTFWKHREIIRLPLILPQWVIFLGSLCTTMISLDQPASIFAMVQDFYLYLCFLSLVNMVGNESDFRKMRKAWALAACLEGLLLVLAIIGIGRNLFVMPLKIMHQPIPGTEGQSGRAMGTVGHPNLTGAYMLSGLFVFLSLRYPQKIWQRVLIGLFLFVGVFTTGSNGDIIACLISIFIVLAYLIARSGGKSPLLLGPAVASLGVVACLVVVMIILGVPSSIAAIMESSFLRYSMARLLGASVITRTNIIVDAWGVYRDYPLGVGPNALAGWLEVGTTHSDYLAHMVERGPLAFIGLMLFCVEIFTWLKSSMELTKNTPEKQFEVVALGAGLVGSFITGFAYEVMHWRHHWLLITLVFAQNKLLRIQGADTEMVAGTRDSRSSSRLATSDQ